MRNLEQIINNEDALLKVCANMEFLGVRMDREYVEKCYLEENRLAEEARLAFKKNTGEEYKDSGKLFARIFDLRNESYPRTEKGNPSFASDFLEHCTSPTAKLINNIRHHEKRISTYFYNFLYYMDGNGYIHPSMNQGGTKTGRFSYSQPNLQNLPKEDEEDCPTNIRRAFIPLPGTKILSIDYDQQEFRLLLDYAGEVGLIKEINEGADVHQATADLLNIPRKFAKTLNFALLYGVGVDKLALMLGVTTTAARELREVYFGKLPKVKRFIYTVRKTAERRGFTFNRFGRIYWCSDYRFSYKHSNYIIQGTGADIIKTAMVQIDERLKDRGSRLALQVHDELMLYLADGEDYLLAEIQKIMESIYVPFNGMRLTTSVAMSDKSFSHWDLQ